MRGMRTSKSHLVPKVKNKMLMKTTRKEKSLRKVIVADIAGLL